ncbi:MAG: hypothetical protein M3P27_12250, partial [Acidobacteriota bacterium]|nr:hypothetical protein [Acidobacteriota bacterium]
MGRRFLIALSLANLMFLRIWRELLNGKLAYYSKVPPNGLMVGLMLDVLLLGALFWLAAELVERSRSPLLRSTLGWIFFVLVLLTASFNKLAVVLHARLGMMGLVLFGLLAIALCAIFARWQDRIAHGLAVLLLVASPFVAVTFAQGAWLLYQVNGAMNFAELPPAAMLPPPSVTAQPGPRVVWIIFDELDQKQAFVARDPSVQMPEFDRLRAESLYAENAYPPARATELSLPALLTGRLVAKATPLGSDELILQFGEDKTPHRWSRE